MGISWTKLFLTFDLFQIGFECTLKNNIFVNRWGTKILQIRVCTVFCENVRKNRNYLYVWDCNIIILIMKFYSKINEIWEEWFWEMRSVFIEWASLGCVLTIRKAFHVSNLNDQVWIGISILRIIQVKLV